MYAEQQLCVTVQEGPAEAELGCVSGELAAQPGPQVLSTAVKPAATVPQLSTAAPLGNVALSEGTGPTACAERRLAARRSRERDSPGFSQWSSCAS